MVVAVTYDAYLQMWCLVLCEMPRCDTCCHDRYSGVVLAVSCWYDASMCSLLSRTTPRCGICCPVRGLVDVGLAAT